MCRAVAATLTLPPYSPELQPAERLWPLVDEAVANRHFATLDVLDAAVARRGTCKRSYGLRRMRWLGLAKAGLQVRLAAMAYNLRRSWRLLAPKPA